MSLDFSKLKVVKFKYNGGSNPGKYRLVLQANEDVRHIVGYELSSGVNPATIHSYKNYLKEKIEDITECDCELILTKATSATHHGYILVNNGVEKICCDTAHDTLYNQFPDPSIIVYRNGTGAVFSSPKSIFILNLLTKKLELTFPNIKVLELSVASLKNAINTL